MTQDHIIHMSRLRPRPGAPGPRPYYYRSFL